MTQKSLPEPVFLSAPKVATLCGVSRNTVCYWIRAGKLAAYHTAGGKNLIRPSDLVQFMEENSMFVPPALEEMAAKDIEEVSGVTKDRETTAEPAILVVDDDPGARALAVLSLQPLKMPILEAETGYEAMHLLTQNPHIALIVLDLVMPGQHGARTFDEIRSQYESLPVIVVTGFPPGEGPNKFGDEKPDLIITKPYSREHLLDAAKAYLADVGL